MRLISSVGCVDTELAYMKNTIAIEKFLLTKFADISDSF